MRRWVRAAAIGVTTGALAVSTAWAGIGLAPVDVDETVDETVDELTETVEDAVPSTGPGAAGSEIGAAQTTEVPEAGEGEILAGAAKVSMEPRPDDYDGTWQTEGCETFGDDAGQETLEQLPDTSRTPWPASPDCIYMGGHGIGPMNAITSWDEDNGLWVRAVALSDGDETIVLTLIDAVYYFAAYDTMCADCGAFQIADRLGPELGIDPAGFFIVATHAHTAPDLIGGWGGVPAWYMTQVEDAIEDAIRGAVAHLRPATLEIGEQLARPHNRERRNTYRAAEEVGLSWFRAYTTGDAPGRSGDRARGGPHAEAATEVIATVGAYAAHPVTVSAGAGVAHADWPGVFASAVEERFGGIAANFPTGLGNMSTRGGTQMGVALADLIPDVGGGTVVDTPDIAVAAERWRQPITNTVLGALGAPGFFDRPFEAGPAEVSPGTHDAKPCVSASTISVLTGVSAARIGPLVITGAPGETFSNLSNTIKEANPHGVTLPLGMTNDGLGYIIQSFESDFGARQGLGFVAQDAGFEYEEAYSIDECFGDQVLETTLALLAGLGG